MGKLAHIEFKREKHSHGDYFINGKPLMRHLMTHEEIPFKGDFKPAFLGSGSLDHLILKREPDLEKQITAIYLCGMCGGYESALGTKIVIENETIIWTQIGRYNDYVDETIPPTPFKKVKEYRFDKSQYFDFIETTKIHETPYYG